MSKTVSDSQMRAIRANLHEAIRINGWNQTDLAERIGKHPSTISHHLRGKQNMAVKTAEEYAKLLGMNYSDFTRTPEISPGKETGVSPHAYEEPKPEKKSKRKPTKQHSVPNVPNWCSSQQNPSKKPEEKYIDDMTIKELQDMETAISLKQGKFPRKVEVKFTPAENFSPSGEEPVPEIPKPAPAVPEKEPEPSTELAEPSKSLEPEESQDSITISVTINGMKSLKELLALLPRNFRNSQK